jgi:hypothetical protein
MIEAAFVDDVCLLWAAKGLNNAWALVVVVEPSKRLGWIGVFGDRANMRGGPPCLASLMTVRTF